MTAHPVEHAERLSTRKAMLVRLFSRVLLGDVDREAALDAENSVATASLLALIWNAALTHTFSGRCHPLGRTK